jgi:hypothetical protein
MVALLSGAADPASTGVATPAVTRLLTASSGSSSTTTI